MADAAADIARLRWRCRRGVKELDVLLERFLAEGLGQLAAPERVAFSRLLDATDPDIMDWLLERNAPPDAAFAPLLSRLRALMPARPAPGP